MINLKSISFLLFLVSFTIQAQYHSITRTDIEESNVPQEVKSSFQRDFSDGFVVNWKYHTKDKSYQNDTNYYRVEFKKGGRFGNYAFYNDSGTMLAYLLHVNPFELPGSIQESAKNNLARSNIKSAELIDLENPKRQIYRIRLNNQGLLKYIYYDMSGNLLDKMKLPADIFVFI